MAEGLFRTGASSAGRDVSPIPSEHGDSPAGSGPRKAGGRAAGRIQIEVPGRSGGIFTEDVGGPTLVGRGPVAPDRRKFRYDVLRGKGEGVGFEATKDDRMSAEEAGEMLHRIHQRLGVDRELEGVLRAFDAGMFFCHTVNGGSTLAPGRAKFRVPGVSTDFDFGMIRDLLGVDQRRFFRAFADDIAEVNKAVLRSYDPYDPVSVEHRGWLMQVASERVLSRYPHLAHDSADACLSLSPSERAALAASKVQVISTSNNAADRLSGNNRTKSADNYDSTVGKSI